MIMRRDRRLWAALIGLVLAVLAARADTASQGQPQFGGAYGGLDARRQDLVKDWVSRFAEVTGQRLPPEALYDDIVSFSTKTTFEAVTHALMRSSLTDSSGAALGDALALIERVEAVKGEIPGASGDHQFRMYVRLKANALDTLERSREFARGADNTVYHKGYPINYREQGGTPSIQFSVALDGRRADIDVDYRSSSFPAALFNGHLSSANSDVRAGNNYDRHVNRWVGFQNWWRGFFGVHLDTQPDDTTKATPFSFPKVPRAGKKNIDVMVNDYLTAWLVEGNIVEAMGYVSEHAYACLAQDEEDPTNFDRGMAPFQLMDRLKAAHDALGTHNSLEGLTVGTRYAKTGLKVIQQPHHAQFVIYAVPDTIAAEFDCESRLTLADSRKVEPTYGRYYGSTFTINGRTDQTVALLWSRENGYWKIVSWQTGSDVTDTPDPDAPPADTVVKIKADASLVQASHDFLESWLIRKDYDAAFRYLSPDSYACYRLNHSPGPPASATSAELGQRIRAALEESGRHVGKARTLDEVISAVQSSHPVVRVMEHPYLSSFTLTGLPNAIVDAANCDAMARGARFPKEIAAEFGKGYGMTIRFRTKGGEAPVLRTVWRKQDNAWRIVAYDVEVP